MVLDNKLGITDAVRLAAEEEKLSKQKAIRLFDDSQIKMIPTGSFESYHIFIIFFLNKFIVWPAL